MLRAAAFYEKQALSTAPSSPPSSPPFHGALPSTLPSTSGDLGAFSAVAGGRDSYTSHVSETSVGAIAPHRLGSFKRYLPKGTLELTGISLELLQLSAGRIHHVMRSLLAKRLS